MSILDILCSHLHIGSIIC